MGYVAEVVRHLVAEVFPLPGDGLTHECKNCIGELLLTWVVAIMGDELMR
jgi:hypothetical protein